MCVHCFLCGIRAAEHLPAPHVTIRFLLSSERPPTSRHFVISLSFQWFEVTMFSFFFHGSQKSFLLFFSRDPIRNEERVATEVLWSFFS